MTFNGIDYYLLQVVGFIPLKYQSVEQIVCPHKDVMPWYNTVFCYMYTV